MVLVSCERKFFKIVLESCMRVPLFVLESAIRISLVVLESCLRFTLDVLESCNSMIIEPVHEISNNMVCATSKASDQPAHTRSLIRAFTSRLSIL